MTISRIELRMKGVRELRRSYQYAALALAFIAVGGCTSGVSYTALSPGPSPYSPSPLPDPSEVDSNSSSAAPTLGVPLDTTGLTILDLATDAGVYSVNDTWSATPADYDGDGDTDVLIGYHAQGAKLWRNDAGRFTQVSPSGWPVRPDRHNCAWGDANQDGRLDVYCTVGRLKANYVKVDARPDNELWLQQEDGSFIDVGTDWGLGDPYGRGRATTFIDANGDEFPDLFVGNTLPRDTDLDGGVGGENKLFLNSQAEGFVAAPEFGLDALVGARCAHAIDFDADGWQDLFVCGDEANRLYRNDGGEQFVDVTAATDVTTRPQMDVDFGDLDGDDDLDAVFVGRSAVQYQLFDAEAGAFTVPVTISPLSEGQSVTLGDADGNEETDIYVVQSSTTDDLPDILLLNSALAFAAVDVPATSGLGDAVEAIDTDGDGIVEFLVLNGREPLKGPIQLLRLVAGDN